MEMSPILTAPGRGPEVTVVEGGSAAIDAVAGIAAPSRRFLTRSWFAAAAGNRPMRTIAFWRDGVATIALPLVRLRPGLSAVPGAYWPFRSFPVAEGQRRADMRVLLQSPIARRALGPAWRLGPVYADDPAYRALMAAAPEAGWTAIVRRIATSYRLDLPAPGGGFPRTSTLKKNRFHEKHLASHGEPDWAFHCGRDWSPALFDALAEIEARSWHSDSLDAKFLNSSHRALWEALAADPAQAARMNVALLRIDGRPTAYSFDIDSGSVRYAIANSYDPAVAKHSPGKCLYYRNIVDGQSRGIRMIDWGAGDSGYKSTIGAKAGPEIVDVLLLRGRLGRIAARLGGWMWEQSGQRR
ncbi:GNAT family N-acetyltransferase [Sphingomonas jatrophae]|uniref:Acetyltransferase (GNAT) domain-containing protein n=1 Tax=Sphingomonas jatrophae TaxID=1166337 RepID=A0A1I6K4J3_9SPHN|nr:GNAT family N-acetyltransferase [Sphingomonas jatrophae]SFR86183.1 Acetyltransferase (GNAT) domain-containing protein [Sphingomonas jatrophae]